jgi:hypothetical protein
MSKRRLNIILAALTIVAALPQASTLAAPLKPPSNFADPAFKRVWERTDSLVDSGKVKRSWFWGPSAGFTTMEEYDQGPSGKHLVQYFDKSRMEINNPNGDKNHPFYVTNGLLTTELITGKVQMGNDRFALRWPAEISIASDSDDQNAPTYASFRGAYARKDMYLVGKTVTSIVDKSGKLDFTNGSQNIYYGQFDVKYVYFENATNRNIPDVFWNFLNDTGPVMNVNGQQETARLNDPYFYATGFPITDAYWASVKIEGKELTPVLIQPYQRRVLTYVPSAPAGFKVQMGNIGQHYYDWRYKDAGKPASLSGKCESYPKFGFGKLYHDRPEVAIALGCGGREEVRRTVERQKFERGEIIGIIYFDAYNGYDVEDVYVLSPYGGAVDGRLLMPVQRNNPSPTPTPSPGTFSSPRNFDVVLGDYNAALRAQIGNAIAPAEIATAERDSSGKVTGGIPAYYFTGGFMLYPNLAERKIYVLYNTSGIASYSPSLHISLVVIDRWAAYDDTFQP